MDRLLEVWMYSQGGILEEDHADPLPASPKSDEENFECVQHISRRICPFRTAAAWRGVR